MAHPSREDCSRENEPRKVGQREKNQAKIKQLFALHLIC